MDLLDIVIIFNFVDETENLFGWFLIDGDGIAGY
jgi:hypothetical protein